MEGVMTSSWDMALLACLGQSLKPCPLSYLFRINLNRNILQTKPKARFFLNRKLSIFALFFGKPTNYSPGPFNLTERPGINKCKDTE